MTHLPGAEAAFIDPRKISAYLLNAAHPQNGGKARFFLDHGFTETSLAISLADHPRRNPVATELANPHGRKFVVHCTLASPDRRNPCVTSVWISSAGDRRPRLVTVYPRKP
ncbi:MAG: hypothetical protein KGQ52_00040 [Alphaproteobacteria bacterium]|nr:hypothetical protein [Alphaproteobacteria bacterium]